MDGDLKGWLHALGTGPAFWLAMFAASAFGTNLGDLWTGRLGMPGPAGFGSLVVVSAPQRGWPPWRSRRDCRRARA
jgi:hypothetical protein